MSYQRNSLLFFLTISSYFSLAMQSNISIDMQPYQKKQSTLKEKFFNSVLSRNEEDFNDCIAQGIDINVTDENENTALHVLFETPWFTQKNMILINTLLERLKFNINARNIVGKSILHAFMERFSSDLNPDFIQVTPAHLGLLLRKLLERGANPNIQDFLNKYPIESSPYPNPACIEALLRYRSHLTYEIVIRLLKKSYYATTIESFIYCFGLARTFNTPFDETKTERLAKGLIIYSIKKTPQKKYKENFCKNEPIINEKLSNYVQALNDYRGSDEYFNSRDLREGEIYAFEKCIEK